VLQALPVIVVKESRSLRHRLQVADFLSRVPARAIRNADQSNGLLPLENGHA
jgi:hypothetical protein